MSTNEPSLNIGVPPGDAGFSLWELQAAHSGGVLDFARLLHVSSGFSLFVFQYNDATYRDTVIPYLNRHAKFPVILTLVEQDTVDFLEQRLAQLAAAHDLVHVIGLHEWLAGDTRSARLRGLNYHRELIAEQVRTAIVLWMIEDDIKSLALEAPDVWAWRKGVFDFSQTGERRHELELSRIDFGSADLDELRERMTALRSYLVEHPDKTVTRAGLLHELGQILYQLGISDEALDALHEALGIYRGNDFKRDHAFVLGNIARIYADKEDVDKALKLYEEVFQVFEKLGDKRSRAVALGSIAQIYADKGDVDKALKLHEEMLRDFESLGDKRSLAVTLGFIARIHLTKGEMDKALELYEEMLPVVENLGDKRLHTVMLGDIARIYRLKGELEKARKLHEEALKVYENLGDMRARAVTLGNIARIYVEKEDMDKAIKLHEEQLRINEQLGDMVGIANALWSLAQINMKRNQNKEALEQLSQSYEILLKSGRLDGICSVGLDLGLLLCMDGQNEQGLAILDRSEKGFRRLGQEEMAMRVREIITRFEKSP